MCNASLMPSHDPFLIRHTRGHSILIEIAREKKIDLIDNRIKKSYNQKIDFYFINFHKYIYIYFLLAGVISRHVKKWNRRLLTSPYTE